MRSIPTLCAAVALLASSAAAQPQPGDLIIGDIGSFANVAYIRKATNTIHTLVPSVAPDFYNAVQVAENNTDLIAQTSNVPNLLRITPTGTITTVAAFGSFGSPNGIDLGQDGAYVVSSSLNQVRKVAPGGAITTFIASTSATLNGLAYDQETGDLMLGIFSAGLLVRHDGVTGAALNTLATGLASVSGVDQSPSTGNFTISTFTLPYGRTISRTGTTVATFSGSGFAQGVKVDDQTGNIYLANGNGTVSEHTPGGTTVKTYGPFSGYNFTNIDVYGSRVVSGVGSAQPGSPYTVNFNFPGQGNSTYVAALSFTQRPGIPLSLSQTVNLTPDGLFFASLAGAFVTGFQGTLNSAGNATGTILIPSFVPVGVTFFCSCVAVAGSSIISGNTLGITTR